MDVMGNNNNNNNKSRTASDGDKERTQSARVPVREGARASLASEQSALITWWMWPGNHHRKRTC